MSDYTMRAAVPDDLTTVTALVRDAYRGYIERMGREPAPMLDDYAALIGAQRVRVAGEAAHPELVVGVLVAWPDGDDLYVDNVAVSTTLQGSGIGKVLLNDAEWQAYVTRRSCIRLYTNEAMTENLAYYPRRGFVETRRSVDNGYRRVHFAKVVTPPPVAATPTTMVDDGTFRVTEWRFPPGGATGFHRHGHDYVVVPMTTGDLEIVSATGTVRSPLAAGVAYSRHRGIEHDVRNPNPFEFVFVEVEHLD